MVTILETSGERLDHSKARNLMDQYFERIERFSESASLPSRVRFRLLDVIDMRGREWRQRRQIAGPRPVSEIRAEYGTSMDPTKLTQPTIQPGQSKIQRERDRKEKKPCAFFAKPTGSQKAKEPESAKKPSFFNGRGDEPGRDERNYFITKTFTDEPRRYQSPVRRPYNEFVRPNYPPVPKSPGKENGDEDSKKKSFMPDFIKPHHVKQMMDRSNANSSSAKYQPPQYQARSGFPGQNLNAPSPVDRVNSARQMHLRRNQGDNRRESPNRASPNRASPHRSSPTGRSSPNHHNNARSSPTSQSPIRNNGHDRFHYSPIRNSPSRASPISPLAENGEKDIPKKMTIEESLKLAEDCSMRYINGDDRALSIFTSSKLPRKAQISVCQYIMQKSSLDTAHCKEWTVILKQWTNHDAMQEAVTNWLGQEAETLGPNAPVMIANAVSNNLVDPCSLESLFVGGKYFPTFFLVLKELFNSMGIVYIQRKFGKFINLEFQGIRISRDYPILQ